MYLREDHEDDSWHKENLIYSDKAEYICLLQLQFV